MNLNDITKLSPDVSEEKSNFKFGMDYKYQNVQKTRKISSPLKPV